MPPSPRMTASAQAESKNFCGSPVTTRSVNSVMTEKCSIRCRVVNLTA